MMNKQNPAMDFATGMMMGAMMNEAAGDAAQAGRSTDSIIGHLSPGEVVIPAELFQDPEVALVVRVIFDTYGIDVNEYIVGHASNKINPETGYPEFFLKKVAKAVTGAVKSVVGAVGSVVGGVLSAVGLAPEPKQPAAQVPTKETGTSAAERLYSGAQTVKQASGRRAASEAQQSAIGATGGSSTMLTGSAGVDETAMALERKSLLGA